MDQLEGLARRQPVFVLLEDLHWIDPTTRELDSTGSVAFSGGRERVGSGAPTDPDPRTLLMTMPGPSAASVSAMCAPDR